MSELFDLFIQPDDLGAGLPQAFAFRRGKLLAQQVDKWWQSGRSYSRRASTSLLLKRAAKGYSA
jgi:hypothetical protein